MAVSAESTPPQTASAGSVAPGPQREAGSASPNRAVAWRLQRTRDSEERQSTRRSLRCALTLVKNATGRGHDAIAVPAECSNISQGGLYGIVPIGYGVAIGQRFTFELTIGERGPEPGPRQVVSQQGEIMRAELLLGEDGYGDRVGVGVRFFGPRSGVVPMPTRV